MEGLYKNIQDQSLRIEIVQHLQENRSEPLAIQLHILLVHEGMSDELEPTLVERDRVLEYRMVPRVLIFEAALVDADSVLLVP